MLRYERIYLSQLIRKRCFHFFNIAKYFNKWKKSISEYYSPINQRKPWLTLQAISILDRELKSGNLVFEYGGGGSTLYFLDKGANVITVEHDESWFKLLKKRILINTCKNWTGVLAKPQYGNSANDPSDPDLYVSMDENYSGYCFKNYASSIDCYPDSYFDFIVIDGRSRPSCIKHSFDKVKPGGYLILDNTERDYYLNEKTLCYFNSYVCVLDQFSPTLGHTEFTKTTVWQKRNLFSNPENKDNK